MRKREGGGILIHFSGQTTRGRRRGQKLDYSFIFGQEGIHLVLELPIIWRSRGKRGEKKGDSVPLDSGEGGKRRRHEGPFSFSTRSKGEKVCKLIPSFAKTVVGERKEKAQQR